MHPNTPEPPRTPRRDGWTPARRERFLEHLAAGLDVKRACALVGLSREGAYRLRRRDATFAGTWDAALAEGRAAEVEAFFAGLPERLRRTCRNCQLRVTLEGREFCPWTPFHPSNRVTFASEAWS